MADKTYIWDDTFLTDDPNEDTGLVRWSGSYINDTREALTERLKDEHIWDPLEPSPQTRMGAHKSGSGISYYSGIAPAYRPDGVTLLDTDDVGRLWFDSANGQINGWTGTAWQNLSAQGIGTILRWQTDAQYSLDEIVEYNGYLWVGVADPPPIGVTPGEPDWTLFAFPMPYSYQWYDQHTYKAGGVVYHANAFWTAVSPVYNVAPGVVPGQWTQVEFDTASFVDLSVTTEKINNSAVTNTKLGPDAVTTDKILNETILTEDIADAQIVEAKLGPQAVTEAKIANGAVAFIKAGTDLHKVAIWRADAQYALDDIVNVDGYWWVAVVASPLLGTKPLKGSSEWHPWTDQTTGALSNTGTVVAGNPDESVFCDTSINPSYPVTLEDGLKAGDKVTLAAFGGGEIQVIGTGLTDQTQNNTAIQYMWSGSEYLPLGGGTGGGGAGVALGEVTWWPAPLTTPLPAGKLVADGSIVNIADYASLFGRIGTTWGGDGVTTFGLPNIQGIFPGAIGVQGTHGDAGWNVGDIIEDSVGPHDATFVGSALASHRHLSGNRKESYAGMQGTLSYSYVASSGNSQNPSTSGAASLQAYSQSVSGGTPAGSITQVVGTETRPASAMGQWLIQAEPPEPASINAVVVDVDISDVRWSPATDLSPNDMVCDGTLLDISSYPELYARIGTTYGGDGVTTFALPNLEGIFPGALGVQGTHGDAGNVLGDLVEDSFEDHDHASAIHNHLTGVGNVHPQNSVFGNGSYGSTNVGTFASNNAASHDNFPWTQDTTPPNTGHRGGTETRPASLMGNWIIRVTQPASYVLPTLTDLFDIIYPVGSSFMQLPGAPSPLDSVWPGTWINDSASHAGEFFRVEGGNASTFESGPQAQGIPAMYMPASTNGSAGDCRSINSASCYGFGGLSTTQTGITYRNTFVQSGFPVITSNSSGSAYPWATDIRPTNSTIRVWKRTA